MLHHCLHFLLCLSLALNGLAAPMSSTHALAGAHAAHGAVSEAPSAHDHSTAHHARGGGHTGHQHHATAALDASTTEADTPFGSNDCCADGQCQCGCALPSFAATEALAIPVQSMADDYVPLPDARFAPLRASPPLRPPAA